MTGDTRRLPGRVPFLDREWLEVSPDLREYLNKLAQILADTAASAGDEGAAIAFFMGSSFAMGGGGGGPAGGAPTTAEYLVGALDGTLTAERLVTDTGTVTWNLATPGAAKANADNPEFLAFYGL
jgi:hypothetical protein